MELTIRGLAGIGEITLEQLFPWVSLMAVFLVTTFVVREEVEKYNIPDRTEEEDGAKRYFKSVFDGYLMWLGALFCSHVIFEVLIHIRGYHELYLSLILVRALSIFCLACLVARFVHAQLRFKLKVAP